MRVLVTGGAGYIGSFTVRALQDRGHAVVVYDNLSYGHREAVDGPIVEGDLGDNACLEASFADGRFDAVIHLAALIEAGESMHDAASFFMVNVADSVALLNAAVRHNVPHLVFSSSAGVYGNPSRVPIDERDPAVPINTYAETKLLVERMLPWYELVHGLRSVSLRYFNAAGAALDGSMGQDHQPATHLLSVAVETAAGRRDKLVLYGDDYPTPDGTCIRDYIHVLDLASAHVMALDYLACGGTNETFNVGAGSGHSNLEVIGALRRISGVDIPVEVGPRRPGDPAQLVANPSKIEQAFGWRAENSNLNTIVSSAWKWQLTHPNGYAS
ncbi:MAG TPA: UDP-glucose 4-epimerase GalE [Chloroflexota bacterium]